MDKKKIAHLVNDYHANGLSYRALSRKYGIALSTIYRMINKKRPPEQAEPLSVPVLQADTPPSPPEDVRALKEELRQAKLKIELLNAVIDIAGQELGVDLRKKSGTRQSR